MEVIVGTAGHIDHGKTSLVKTLTGIDADRLPEEKQRGITIDLGFAEMEIGGHRIGFVDVPGHERFVKNMLAGASGIDVMLLVIAADEGVMPQTREHFEICRLLGVKRAIIAITKTDLVDDETADLAQIYAAELVAGTVFENAPVVRFSSRSGEGVAELSSMLADAAAGVERRSSHLVTRLPIDRSFTVKGFGTVVTGTLASGQIEMASRLELMPAQTAVRVRGLQVNGNSSELIAAGQRTAVNLASVDHADVSRGMELVDAGILLPTQVIDAEIEVLASAPKPLRSRQRVRVHLGTAEILARLHVLSVDSTEIAAGRTDLLQLRLETPAVAVPGQRFIIRSYSPQVTIAGGCVIDNLAERHRRKDLDSVRQYLSDMLDAANDAGNLIATITSHAERSGILRQRLQASTGFSTEAFEKALGECLAVDSIINADGRYISVVHLVAIESEIERCLTRFHQRDPLENGIAREALFTGSLAFLHPNIATAAIKRLQSRGRIVVENDSIRLAEHNSQMAPDEAAFTDALMRTLENSGLEVPRIAEAVEASLRSLSRDRASKLLHMLVSSGRIVKVSEEFYFAQTSIARTIELVKAAGGTMDVAAFKGLTGVSRKYAIPLLEYFDRIHVTARVGDKRVVLK